VNNFFYFYKNKKIISSGTGRKFVFRKTLAVAGVYREKNPHACRAYPAKNNFYFLSFTRLFILAQVFNFVNSYPVFIKNLC